ncbi:MAG: hypothetical protein ACQEWD_14940 [Bacteroidota bacterium]
MSLYDNELTNKEILNDKRFRWKNFCLDLSLLHRKPKLAHKFTINWNEVKFLRKNGKHIPDSQGIYMFVVNIENKIGLNENSKYILYIGQTVNLKSRYMSYFRYEDSDQPSDFLKRCMVLIWKNKLDFHFFETGNVSKKELDNIEFDLIDSVVPPFNIRFRGDILKNTVKFYSPR